MKTKAQYTSRVLREAGFDPVGTAVERFGDRIGARDAVDAQFLDAAGCRLVAFGGLVPWRPILRAALSDPRILAFIRGALGADADGLFLVGKDGPAFLRHAAENVSDVPVPDDVAAALTQLHRASVQWAGALNDQGEYVCDPRTPSPGTHFRANLLVGDRAGFAHPLLTTPKALVDEWGGGSSRSHADKQILATRWDVVPEENGFPANRQFYVVENGRQIFFSAAPGAEVRVETRHAANHSVISYELPDGLRIRRSLFIMSAEAGLPLGVEVQLVEVENGGAARRDLEIVMTGMFGFPHPGALVVDVIYTCVTVEPRVLQSVGGGAPFIVTPRYAPNWGADDQPFHLSVAFGPGGEVVAPRSFCLDYRKFIGNGSLEKPQGACCLDNALPKKGPAFFAVMLPLSLGAGEKAECQSFNGLLSRHEGEPISDEVVSRRMEEFAGKAADPCWARAAFARVREFHESYRRAVQVRTPKPEVDRLVNAHLPFQIRYQTYVSRSFGLTQKGFRQIGFREIQDLFGALPFELAAGRRDHVCDLIGVWTSHVHRFGYADHQFYWTGMEPGRYSDDALWLFQAVGRYVDLTGDAAILDAEWPVAGENSKRPLFDTLEAILRYGGKISIGRNGLPLLDHADWNDTLNLDGEGIHGPEKQKLYRQQVADRVIREGEGLQSDLSESVMNGFLLEIARAYMVRFARMKGESAVEREWIEFGPVLKDRLQKAWKGDFFARCFINRSNEAGTTYLGAQGDGLSNDPALPGSYFLNSFSWSVLSGIATEEQIETMVGTLERALLTPFGLRVSSPTKFRLIMPHTGSGDYLYGDRENGGVFKHANMMATVAMIDAARAVRNPALAEKLVSLAWRVLQVTAPFVTFRDPFRLAGNPRLCTQYTNPATQEHVGPLLSGTAPWMWLSYLNMLGVRFDEGRVTIDPILPAEWDRAGIELQVPAGRYRIEIRKPGRFVRSRDAEPETRVDGKPGARTLPPAKGGSVVAVDIAFR